jgi:hypothetical protein
VDVPCALPLASERCPKHSVDDLTVEIELRAVHRRSGHDCVAEQGAVEK